MPRLHHRQDRPAYANALPGNCMYCGKPGADIRRNRWHQTCWDRYREGSNYRGAAERREGQLQRCVVCKRTDGEMVTVDGKPIRIKVQRDHIVSLALNGPRGWTGGRCQLCHQEKTNDDNARARAWREQDPRARRAKRPDRRPSMANTRPRASASKTSRAPSDGGGGTGLAVVLALAIIGSSAITFFEKWPQTIRLAVRLGGNARELLIPSLIVIGTTVLACMIATYWVRRVRRAREEAIYRLKGAISKEARVAPDVLAIKARAWSHGIPVRGQCWYGETFDDREGSDARLAVEEMLEHKLGLNLSFDWESHRDTVHWWPAPEFELDDEDEDDDDPAADASPAEPTAAEKAQAVQQRVEEKVRALVKSKDVNFDWGAIDEVGPTCFRVTYPSTYKDEDGEVRNELAAGVNSKAPQRWRATWDTEQNTVLFERRPPMPSNILIPVVASDDTWRLPFGQDEHGDQVVWDLKNAPHAIVAGETGSGKTVTLRSLIQAAVARGFVVFCVDPKRIELSGLRGWPGVRTVATEVTEMIALVELLADMMDQRYADIENGLVKEDDLDPVLVVIDEAREFIDRVNAYWRANKTGSGTEHPVVERMRSMARLGRSGRVHILLGIQRPDAKVIGGEARDNFGFRVALGSLSPEGAKMMFGRSDVGRDIPEDAKGRATVAVGGEVIEVQGYNTPDPRSDETPAALALLTRLRELAEQHASDALSYINADYVRRLAEVIRGDRRTIDEPITSRRRTSARKAVSAPPRRQDRWPSVGLDELADDLPAIVRMVIDGEPTEVQITSLDESPDSDDLVEVTYKTIDGTEQVIAVDASETVERRPR